MELIKFIFTILFAFIFGFGFWYLIFWFITSQPNLFYWHWITKTLYLAFSFLATSGVASGLTKE